MFYRFTLIFSLMLVSCASKPLAILQFSSSMFETARIGNGTSHFEIESKKISPSLVLLGPFEQFKGEVTIIDGVIYHSAILDGKAQRQEPEVIKMVFNVRAECSNWERMAPFVAKDISELEAKIKTEKIFFQDESSP